MAVKLVRLGIKRQRGFLYYIDKIGDVSCAKIARGKKRGGGPKKIAKTGIRRKAGYLYFLDKKGDISVTEMARRAKKIK